MNREIRIAIVDDDVYTVKAIEKKLKEVDVVIDSFTDPIIALNDIMDKKHDIIITDNSMPNIDGVELAERILRLYNPVIILISVMTNNIEKYFAEEKIFDYLLQKPLDMDELVCQVREIVQEIAINDIGVKDKLFLNEIISILTDTQGYTGVYKKLSSEMHKDESSIRRRLNKINDNIAISNKHEKPIELIYRIIETNKKNTNIRANKRRREESNSK